MGPYADDGGLRVRTHGPEVDLRVSMVTPIGLIIHELATNAVKYGALSVQDGTVDIRWEVAPGRDAGNGEDAGPELRLEWTERGGPPPPEAARGVGGFGVRMTTLAAGQLGGTILRDWPSSGAVITIAFPLQATGD